MMNINEKWRQTIGERAYVSLFPRSVSVVKLVLVAVVSRVLIQSHLTKIECFVSYFIYCLSIPNTYNTNNGNIFKTFGACEHVAVLYARPI